MTAGDQADLPPPQKADPETLVLRASPRRPVRFRRGLLIGVAAASAASIATIAWVALQPAGFSLVGNPDALQPDMAQNTPEALKALPESYGQVPAGVPQLGPPLPGDLGRPILEHQREMATEPPPPGPAQMAAPDPAAQAAEAERQRRRAEAEQARQAPLLVQISRNAAADAGAGALVVPPDAPAGAGAGEGGPTAPAGQAQNVAFAGRRDESGSVNPHQLQPPASRWQLSAGSIISASLMTGLNSDLPGMVIAQVTENAYDSATGRTILVPQGSRLIGRYNSVVAFGQSRALLVWQRLVLPDGSSIELDNLPAADAAGYAGLEDRVDFHTWRVLRGIGLSTLLGVGTQLTFGESEADLVRALRESAQQNGDRAGQRLVERNLDIQPTIRVRPGYPVRVLVHKDLILRPWRG